VNGSVTRFLAGTPSRLAATAPGVVGELWNSQAWSLMRLRSIRPHATDSMDGNALASFCLVFPRHQIESVVHGEHSCTTTAVHLRHFSGWREADVTAGLHWEQPGSYSRSITWIRCSSQTPRLHRHLSAIRTRHRAAVPLPVNWYLSIVQYLRAEKRLST